MFITVSQEYEEINVINFINFSFFFQNAMFELLVDAFIHLKKPFT